jgi:hypothetical protein
VLQHPCQLHQNRRDISVRPRRPVVYLSIKRAISLLSFYYGAALEVCQQKSLDFHIYTCACALAHTHKHTSTRMYSHTYIHTYAHITGHHSSDSLHEGLHQHLIGPNCQQPLPHATYTRGLNRSHSSHAFCQQQQQQQQRQISDKWVLSRQRIEAACCALACVRVCVRVCARVSVLSAEAMLWLIVLTILHGCTVFLLSKGVPACSQGSTRSSLNVTAVKA